MNRDTTLIERRNNDIRRDYEKLRSERKGRGAKYTVEYILHRLSERYYLSVVSIERVVYGATEKAKSGDPHVDARR